MTTDDTELCVEEKRRHVPTTYTDKSNTDLILYFRLHTREQVMNMFSHLVTVRLLSHRKKNLERSSLRKSQELKYCVVTNSETEKENKGNIQVLRDGW